MTSIFISYSSKDVKIAESIQEYLKHDGFDVWRDKSKIRSDWSKEIAYALSRQDVALILWSEDSSNSQWVKNEWITARALGKPIILVVIAALDRLPEELVPVDQDNAWIRHNMTLMGSDPTSKIITIRIVKGQ